jgi:uncharacterized protein YgbK (DUF1537 family)
MIGVIADDITGANDIGIMFAKRGTETHVYSFAEGQPFALAQPVRPDVLIMDTDSRFDSPETAYRKVFEATRCLQRLGCTAFYNKTCSVFRGNIGAEFDAMLDALGESFALVVLGFPKNGRTTLDGVHYVHGNRLEHSEFRHDPVHPMTRSELVDILQSQTSRKVARIGREIIAQGSFALQEEIERMKRQCQYLILDVPDQEALRVIALAAAEEKVVCGSSALAEEWPPCRMTATASSSSGVPIREDRGLGVLCTVGSLMPQTAEQVRHLQSSGVACMELDTLQLLEKEQGQALVERLTREAVNLIRSGQDAVVHSTHEPASVKETKAKAAATGMSNIEVSRLVSRTLARITDNVLRETRADRLIVAGGDTSAAVCERLGIRGMKLWKEIQPGLPSCVSFTSPPLFLVLKSGSFGSADFLQLALDHLKWESAP